MEGMPREEMLPIARLRLSAFALLLAGTLEVGVVALGFRLAVAGLARALMVGGVSRGCARRSGFSPSWVAAVVLTVALGIESGDEVFATEFAKFADDALAFLGFVPKEEHVLSLLVLGAVSGEHAFERIRMVTAQPSLGADGHGCGGEVLHLFELEVETFGDCRQLCHIFGFATRVGGDEIRDELLAQSCLSVDAIEDGFELVEETERGLAHEVEHAVAGMFGRDFETPRDMVHNQFARIVHRRFAKLLVFVRMEQEVVAHPRTDETFLHTWQGVDFLKDVEHWRVVGIEIGANARVDARRTLTFLADVEIFSLHTIHVG